MGTILVVAVLLVCVALAIRSVHKSHQSGGCSGGCSGCGGSCSCHTEHKH